MGRWGRDWNDVATAKECLRPPEAGREEEGFSLRAFGGSSSPCPELWENTFLLLKATQDCGDLLQHPKETHTPYFIFMDKWHSYDPEGKVIQLPNSQIWNFTNFFHFTVDHSSQTDQLVNKYTSNLLMCCSKKKTSEPENIVRHVPKIFTTILYIHTCDTPLRLSVLRNFIFFLWKSHPSTRDLSSKTCLNHMTPFHPPLD